MDVSYRKTYPSDVSDDGWAFVVPYLTLMTEAAGQRKYALREHDVRELLRVANGRSAQPPSQRAQCPAAQPTGVMLAWTGERCAQRLRVGIVPTLTDTKKPRAARVTLP